MSKEIVMTTAAKAVAKTGNVAQEKAVDPTPQGNKMFEGMERLSFEINKDIFKAADVAITYRKGRASGKMFMVITIETKSKGQIVIPVFARKDGKGITANCNHEDYQWIQGQTRAFVDNRKAVE